MREDLQRTVWGRVAAIRKRVVKSPRNRRTAAGGAVHPGFMDLSKKLARASQRIRGNRHGRRPE
jgi:hypothetical protein